MREIRQSQSAFEMGKYHVDACFRFQKQYEIEGKVTKIYIGTIDIEQKGCSKYILTTIQTSNIYRLYVKLQFESSSLFNDVLQNTSVRTYKVPFSNKRCRRSEKQELTYLHIDQFHVLPQYQRKGCGSKVMGIIFMWLKVCHPLIKKCIVISPSSIGIPFYNAVGAKRQNSGHNLEFNFDD